MSKSPIKFLLTVMIVMLLAACGSTKKSKQENDYYEEIKEKGIIEVGSTPSGPPFTFLNKDTNEIDGLMVDIARAVGDELNLEVKINPVDWVSLMPSIESGKIDMISAGMGITEKREEQIDFSSPVYSYGEAIVIRIDETDIEDFADLAGKRVGAQEATQFLDRLNEEEGIDVQGYKTIQDMYRELKNGRIDAFVADYPIYINMLAELPSIEDEVKLVANHEPQWIVNLGIGMPKASGKYQEEINKAIDKLEETGELDEIIKKWNLD